MNIVLIGLAGCGKSSISKILSEKLNIPFVDTDEMIETESNQTIPNIFENFGEKYFRELESEMVSKASKLENHVIATGGGVILNYENMKNLKNNSVIIFINRSPKDIADNVNTLGRPLMAGSTEKIFKLYNERIDLYKKYADLEIINASNISETIEKILKELKNYGYTI